MSKRYRPSNGTEGCGFMEVFCYACERDRPYREDTGDSCPIAARALIFDVIDADYPDEWTYDEKGNPTCTAFLPEGSKVPTDVELEANGQANLLDGAA